MPLRWQLIRCIISMPIFSLSLFLTLCSSQPLMPPLFSLISMILLPFRCQLRQMPITPFHNTLLMPWYWFLWCRWWCFDAMMAFSCFFLSIYFYITPPLLLIIYADIFAASWCFRHFFVNIACLYWWYFFSLSIAVDAADFRCHFLSYWWCHWCR